MYQPCRATRHLRGGVTSAGAGGEVGAVDRRHRQNQMGPAQCCQFYVKSTRRGNPSTRTNHYVSVRSNAKLLRNNLRDVITAVSVGLYDHSKCIFTRRLK